MNQRIGVCSWSLRSASATELVRDLQATGAAAVQLALDPLRTGQWPADEAVQCLRDGGIEIRSGMIGMQGEDYSTLESIRRTGGVRVDAHWEANFTAAKASAALAKRIGIPLITFHAGFLPHDRSDPARQVILERLRAIADCFADHGIRAGLETGQETAETLLDVLDELDRPTIGVNFDPANMILYGMGDPVAALDTLAPRVVQLHIKDAVAAAQPGTWGQEVPAGQGAVDWPALFEVVRKHGLRCDLMVERESPGDRVAEIRAACELVRRFLPPEGGARS